MTRESRLIVVLLVIAAAGVGGLTFIARQYRRTLGATTPPPVTHAAEEASARAKRLVDGFLAARAEATAALPKVAGAASSLSAESAAAYRGARSRALAAHGMTHDDYVAVLTAWRDFCAGMPPRDPVLGAALELRRGALSADELRATVALDERIN